MSDFYKLIALFVSSSDHRTGSEDPSPASSQVNLEEPVLDPDRASDMARLGMAVGYPGVYFYSSAHSGSESSSRRNCSDKLIGLFVSDHRTEDPASSQVKVPVLDPDVARLCVAVGYPGTPRVDRNYKTKTAGLRLSATVSNLDRLYA